jgi:SAM-dependent methyltransferase
MATYSLGADGAEVARLDVQSAAIDEPTRTLLQAAGIAPGMRVLDLGTGLGHVAFMIADLVGPRGEVVAVDNEPRLLKIAAERTAAYSHVRFVEDDVRTFRDDRPFDAVVGRFIVFHLPDREAVLRHHLAALRPEGGLIVTLDYDLGATRTEPPIPLFSQSLDHMLAGFRSAGADPMIGARLGQLLTDVGLTEVRSIGMQAYEPADNTGGPHMVTAVLRSLLPQLLSAGITTPEDLELDTLAQRLFDAGRATGAVFLPPTLVGAWGRTAATG